MPCRRPGDLDLMPAAFLGDCTSTTKCSHACQKQEAPDVIDLTDRLP
jgi:hypothetical protein